MIELYTAPTPNGYKASIALEEMGIPYEVHTVDLREGEQKRPEYLRICPNGRIPAIVDTEEDNLAVFESGAVMIYLAEKCGKFLPTDRRGRSRVIQWLMFQMGGVGPMMGQANVFFRYFPEKSSRLSTATRRKGAACSRCWTRAWVKASSWREITVLPIWPTGPGCAPMAGRASISRGWTICRAGWAPLPRGPAPSGASRYPWISPS